MENLPSHVALGANSNAIDGGIRLWQDVPDPATASSETQAKTPKAAKSAIKVG
jgi:polyphosphate glucokinase